MGNTELTIGVLGMPDNELTKQLLDYMINKAQIDISFVVYWRPSLKDQYKRVKRKLKLSGIKPTIQRIYYALVKAKTMDINCNHSCVYREYFVPHHNSVECQDISRKEKVDVLLLATGAIISHKIIKIPRIATLNAHPGWIPQFRGLGSLYFQLENGKCPAVSVHQVDEGVDTGPLLLREYIEVDPTKGLGYIEKKVSELQLKLMAKVVKRLEREEPKYIDTFSEQSNMTRGMPLRRTKTLDQKLRSGQLKLQPFTY